ncbi:MAG: alpha/beta fold hydrolase, partial [Aureliella sp.]
MDRCECEIDFLLDRGYDVWTMDYRGFGDSIGTMSEKALKEDASRVYANIIPRDLEKPLIVWGRSFGSGVAASVAAKADDKPDLLILETPYWSLVDLAQQKCPILPSLLFRYELPVHEFLKSAGCPIHLIHGTRDDLGSECRQGAANQESVSPARGWSQGTARAGTLEEGSESPAA